MTLPQECDDVTGGVAIPKIREEGEKKKTRKSFFPGVPSKVWDGRRDPSQSPGAPWGPTRCLKSPFPDHVRAHLAPPEAAGAR